MAERGTRGGGSVYQRSSDDLWVTRADIPTSKGEPRKRVTLYSKTQEEAESKRSELLGGLVPVRPAREPGTRSVHLQNARKLGTHTKKEWLAKVYELPRLDRYWIACFYCEERVHISRFEKDHIIPVSRGGSDGLDNLVATCKPCNRGKGTLTGDEWLAFTGRKSWDDVEAHA